MNSSLTSWFTMLALTFWMGIPWEAWPFPPRCVTWRAQPPQAAGRDTALSTDTSSPLPFHPPLTSCLSLTLNIFVLLVPVPVSFIFSLKYPDCQHPNSNQREMDIFTLHLTSIFPAWFVFSLILFSPHMPHFTMYFFCHLPPVCILHLISSVALLAVLNYPHGYNNFVQPACVFLANEQLFSFSWSFSLDTIYFFSPNSKFGLLCKAS